MARPTLQESAQRKFDQAEIELRRRSAEYSIEAIDVIRAVMKDKQTADSPRLRACELLMKTYNDLRLEDIKREEEKRKATGGEQTDDDQTETEESATLEIGGKSIQIC